MSVKDAIQVYFILTFPCYQKNLQVVLSTQQASTPPKFVSKTEYFFKASII